MYHVAVRRQLLFPFNAGILCCAFEVFAEPVRLSDEHITSKVLFIRGFKVMLDQDLAKLYDVETRILIRNVKRTIDRFPDDFMFQLTASE